MFIADKWQDYEVLDCGGGEKLERWGDVYLRLRIRRLSGRRAIRACGARRRRIITAARRAAAAGNSLISCPSAGK